MLLWRNMEKLILVRIVSELVFPYFSIKAFFLTWRTGLGIYLYEKYGTTNSETILVRIVSELVFPYFSIKAFFLTWRTCLGIYLYEEYEQISQNIII